MEGRLGREPEKTDGSIGLCTCSRELGLGSLPVTIPGPSPGFEHTLTKHRMRPDLEHFVIVSQLHEMGTVEGLP